jgi:Mg2+/Co2+ transporter CorB
MGDKGMVVAAMIMQTGTLVLSAAIPNIAKALGDDNISFIFAFCSFICLLGSVFLSTFMKETSGKSATELLHLYDSKY